jgi:hypothetical protein
MSTSASAKAADHSSIATTPHENRKGNHEITEDTRTPGRRGRAGDLCHDRMPAAAATAVPAATVISGGETVSGILVTSGVSGTRTSISSVLVAAGAAASADDPVSHEENPWSLRVRCGRRSLGHVQLPVQQQVPRPNVTGTPRAYNQIATIAPMADDSDRYKANAEYEESHPECPSDNINNNNNPDPESAY